ncbi:MAG TPA: hypothetical protein VKU00_21730 [Chthonomonadaceae bacterium]|nr:hypothetical protein [Chthonomonadaceae bacterium]
MFRTLRKVGVLPICLLLVGSLYWWLKQIQAQRAPSHYVIAQAGPQKPSGGPPILFLRLPGKRGIINSANSRGQEVGGYAPSGASDSHAVLWEQGKMQDLGTLGGRWSVAYHINAQGEVCGDAMTRDHTLHAFLWRQGKMQDLGTLGGKISHAYCLNDRGQVVGESDTGDGVNHAFLYSEGRMKDLGTLGGGMSVAYSINNRGQVVGYAEDRVNLSTVAFVWQKGQMNNLNPLLLTRTNWRLIEGREINDAGEISVLGEQNRRLQSFLITPSP